MSSLDLKPVQPLSQSPTDREVVDAIRVLQENQRRLMEKWRNLSELVDDVENRMRSLLFLTGRS